MNTTKMLVSFFIYFVHSIIGIMLAKRHHISPLLGWILGFFFIPVFFNFLPLLSKKSKTKGNKA